MVEMGAALALLVVLAVDLGAALALLAVLAAVRCGAGLLLTLVVGVEGSSAAAALRRDGVLLEPILAEINSPK